MRLKIIRSVLAAFFALGASAALGAQGLTILVTGDMHGWIEPTREGGAYLGGAAEMLTQWRETEHIKPGQALVLSCGDNYTGPAISTYFKGDSVTDAMNGMGYDASALGNHEFDFGVAKMRDWAAKSRFPFLACNLTKTAASAPELPVLPYKIFSVQGIQVAVVGLTLGDLAGITSAEGWNSSDYAAALHAWVPKARKDGAQVVLVIGHVPFQDLIELSSQIKDLDLPILFGGHSHETTQGQSPAGNWVVNTGCWWRQYARVDLDYDAGSGKTKVVNVKLAAVRGPKAEAATQALLNLPQWQGRILAKAGPVLGFSRLGLARRGALSNLVTDSWLEADPSADLAVCNYHGLRQDLPAGPVNNLQLLSVMPFEDKLIALNLTGAQLLQFLPAAGKGFLKQRGEMKVVAGISEKGRTWVFTKSGRAIDRLASYRVLVNDYLADQDQATKGMKQQLVAGNWRDPVAAFLKEHPSDEAKPLESMVDSGLRMKD